MLKLSAWVAAGVTLVGVVLLWRLSEMLFAAHMGQHLLLIAIAAPLLVLAGCETRMPPIWGWAVFVSVFLFWHWPAAFQWAARNPVTEILELVCILVAAVCFWDGVLGENRFSDGARALMVMTAAFLTDLPGVVMLFSPRAICVMPGENAARFGLTSLQDQQIAGLLMWVPANLVFFAIALFLLARWIGTDTPRRLA